MVHQIIATDLRRPITYYAVLFEADGDEELLDLLERFRTEGDAPRVIGTSHRFFFADLLERHLSGSHDLTRSAQHQFMAFLYALAAGSAHVGRGDNTHVERALAILQGAIEKPLDLATLCQRLGVSREHLVRVFTERMGMPPMRYHMRLKLEAAQAMLADTNLRISEIADGLGFNNPFNFTRAFKRVTGCAPSDYRANVFQKTRIDRLAGPVHPPLTPRPEGSAQGFPPLGRCEITMWVTESQALWMPIRSRARLAPPRPNRAPRGDRGRARALPNWIR